MLAYQFIHINGVGSAVAVLFTTDPMTWSIKVCTGVLTAANLIPVPSWAPSSNSEITSLLKAGELAKGSGSWITGVSGPKTWVRSTTFTAPELSCWATATDYSQTIGNPLAILIIHSIQWLTGPSAFNTHPPTVFPTVPQQVHTSTATTIKRD